MVHVRDLANAFLLSCTVPSIGRACVIAAGPRATTLRELLDTLAKVLGRPSTGPRLPLAPMRMLAAVTEDVCSLIGVSPPLHRRRMDFYINDAEYDCRRAKALLGWTPKIDLESGLKITLQGYREAGWL
jgi:nucleoside-diphosphate-sugar epimerase